MKNCPFCGSDDLYIDDETRLKMACEVTVAYVLCHECGAFGPRTARLTREEARNDAKMRWERRV